MVCINYLETHATPIFLLLIGSSFISVKTVHSPNCHSNILYLMKFLLSTHKFCQLIEGIKEVGQLWCLSSRLPIGGFLKVKKKICKAMYLITVSGFVPATKKKKKRVTVLKEVCICTYYIPYQSCTAW